MKIWDRVRKESGRVLIDSFFKGLSGVTRLAPMAKPEAHGVEVLSNISYGEPGAKHHLLDVYRPMRRSGPMPVVLYIHGGGFRILSKDTHWIMGLLYARRGYLVFNINYRLAPENPFPAGLKDCCKAYSWAVRNAARFGGSLDQGWILAGESAGANLATSLAICSCAPREEVWAREVFETKHPPNAVIAACGMLQVTNPERFYRNRLSKHRRLPRWVADRLEEVSASYLRNHEGDANSSKLSPKSFTSSSKNSSASNSKSNPASSFKNNSENSSENKILELADPLVMLEKGFKADHKLPPFFAPVGTCDPLLDDTRRLKKALDRLNVFCLPRYYPREAHAFMAFVWRKQARLCWQETFDFLSWVRKRCRKSC